MKKIVFTLFLLIFIIGLTAVTLLAQMEGLHGDFAETRNGLHAGNQFRTTFYNDGTFGANQRPPDIAGEWPINSGHIYMIDGNVFVGSEVLDINGELKHIISTVRSAQDGGAAAGEWSTGDQGPNGEWYTFLPLPGFASADTNKIAMSKWPWAWPATWPDKFDDPVDPGWAGSWNGYFGKNIFNADEESYFVADDYANREFPFYPDSTNLERRGLGLRMYVRGFQWSNALVEDGMFALFDLENIGTHEHDKMVFAYKFGNNMGDTMNHGDGGDDSGAYTKEEDVAYLFDFDDIGASDWGPDPVGYFGGAFLESPGNPFDGIDNDNDGQDFAGPTISEAMFTPKTLQVGDDIVLIDYITFERTLTKMPNDTVRTYYQDLIFKFWPGKTVEEIANNLVDDNLNGIIDENNGSTIGEPPNQITKYLYIDDGTGYKYVDYFSGAGSDNPLLDERRDDGIDNDGDWNPLTDDLGQDGAPFTGDPGEGDGQPTYGEPHFDKTDIDETDMMGLTSFTLYYWPDIPHYEDEKVWAAVVPGYFDDLLQNTNVELLYGSGYFPMKPGQIERFSMGILCGSNLDDFLENKRWIAKAYNENYNFSKAPNIPVLTAIPGDGQVTLHWDDFAEKSYDPITGEDFEGYRIYRSTDPGWRDMTGITDGKGSVTYRKPIAQFDLDNEHSGFAPVAIKGVHFYLGDNTGLVHTWIDTTAQNGFTYYYAITSYDRGDPVAKIPPTECTKFISIATTGEIDKGSNVAIVRPEAPPAGFVNADFDSSKIQRVPGTTTETFVDYEIIFPFSIKENNTYRIVFQDTTLGSFNYPATRNFSLVNITSGDTLIRRSKAILDGSEIPITDGFQISFGPNAEQLTINDENSTWSRGGIYSPYVKPFRYRDTPIELLSGDFKLKIGKLGIDTSTVFYRGNTELPAIPVNFKITNMITNKPIKFAFRERDALEGEEGYFTAYTDGSRRDEIIMLNDSLVAGWQISFLRTDDDSLNPEIGDSLLIYMDKPCLSHDAFEFTTKSAKIDNELAKTDMDRIKVVPNPYVVSNSWEPLNPYSSGRGPRELHFIHLPTKCTIKIFNIRGQLVQTIEHESEIWDGTEVWNMLTKDLLDISYGVYVYHVEAEGIGTKIGKFAVIK